ncbi:MAG TPA: M14 family zinc carboxypeptidase [Pirellulales bacterium]|jgi:protein MpaA|nr:M14 family zinc carboxypeptidase [Pirellulales bacterium]
MHKLNVRAAMISVALSPCFAFAEAPPTAARSVAQSGAAGAARTAAPVTSSDSPISIAWEPLGRSVENRLVEFVQIGSGEQNVVVVPALEGNDPLGAELAQRLAAHLLHFPSWLNGLRLTIVRDPNPDGRIRRTAANAHGVEIDRNFRTQRWRRLPENNRWISGREPETEPETRMLADLVADVRPDRIVVLGTSQRQPWLGFSGPADAWARQVGGALGATPQAIDPSAAPGSLAVYCGHDRRIACLVVRVPAGRGAERIWTDYKRALLAALGSGPNDVVAAPHDDMPATGPSSSAHPKFTATNDRSNLEARPRTRTIDEVENGTTLVPVIGRHEGGWHSVKAPIASATPFAPDRATAASPEENPSAPCNVLPVSSGRILTGNDAAEPQVTPVPTAEAPAASPTHAPPRIERLPPIESTPKSQRSRRQQPIPFYPDTGQE